MNVDSGGLGNTRRGFIDLNWLKIACFDETQPPLHAAQKKEGWAPVTKPVAILYLHAGDGGGNRQGERGSAGGGDGGERERGGS